MWSSDRSCLFPAVIKETEKKVEFTVAEDSAPASASVFERYWGTVGMGTLLPCACLMHPCPAAWGAACCPGSLKGWRRWSHSQHRPQGHCKRLGRALRPVLMSPTRWAGSLSPHPGFWVLLEDPQTRGRSLCPTWHPAFTQLWAKGRFLPMPHQVMLSAFPDRGAGPQG